MTTLENGRLEHKPMRQIRPVPTGNARRCRQKLLRFFPKGFQDEKYLDWERGYKWKAHEGRNEVLGRAAFAKLLKAGNFDEVAPHAVRIESRTTYCVPSRRWRYAMRLNQQAERKRLLLVFINSCKGQP